MSARRETREDGPMSLPTGFRWATGGGSEIGGCNGLHIAPEDKRGTLCGLYGPATPEPRVGTKICSRCARLAHRRVWKAGSA
jgi:hypothetical protein